MGIYSNTIRSPRGILLESVGIPVGFYWESYWNVIGSLLNPVGIVLNPIGILLDFVVILVEPYLGALLQFYRRYWNSIGIPIGNYSNPNWNTTGVLLESYRKPTETYWISIGISM